MPRLLVLLGFLLQNSAVEKPPEKPLTVDDFKVYTEHPRLFLNARRLRLLRRERERQSMRWEQFHTLVAGKAPLPEKAFAYALYYQVSSDAAVGKQAIEAALASNDLRQQAIVFDWCQELLTEAQSKTFVDRLEQSLGQPHRTISESRTKVLAALATAGHGSNVSQKFLYTLVKDWWKNGLALKLKTDWQAIPREEHYAFLELMHALRDNLEIDLRDDARKWFKDLPTVRLLTYYPARFPAPENDYYVPFYSGNEEPDVRQSVMSRAADLSLVSYETNAVETQFVQGWVMQDRFLMKSAYGCVYEFLWANPYQPGLSYHHVPLLYYDKQTGLLLMRSSWDEDAVWLGYWGKSLELFADGRRVARKPTGDAEPWIAGPAIVLAGDNPMRISLTQEQMTKVFVLGMKPNHSYEIEVEDEEVREEFADPAGILALSFIKRPALEARLHETATAP